MTQDEMKKMVAEAALEYVEPLEEMLSGRLRNNGTETGRFSSQEPNIQELTAKVDYTLRF